MVFLGDREEHFSVPKNFSNSLPTLFEPCLLLSRTLSLANKGGEREKEREDAGGSSHCCNTEHLVEKCPSVSSDDCLLFYE